MIDKNILSFKKDGKEYKIYRITGVNMKKYVWIENELGEGMGVSEEDMFDEIDEIFNRLF